MHNLGAYRVDRRIRAKLPLNVLKTFSQVMVERGYHSLFFPGGTRSRSGMIESHLKLGLLGAAISANSVNRLRRVARTVFLCQRRSTTRWFSKPETLISDWLSEEGKARYIIEDDEFSRIDRWLSFFRKAVGLNGACVIRFSEPLDPFGNHVDDDGRSIGPVGQSIDRDGYLMSNGRLVSDPQRDGAYTRELSETLVEHYYKDTVIMDTQLVAHVLFRHLVAQTPDMDLFSRLRFRNEIKMDRQSLDREVGIARDRLKVLQGEDRVHLSDEVRSYSPDKIVDGALSALSGYHDHIAASVEGSDVTLNYPNLLLYYQNRLNHFAESIADESQLRAAREIAEIGLKR
ncbi:MAG: hypothetical protein R3A47_02755 [Polyangiales bacterium]